MTRKNAFPIETHLKLSLMRGGRILQASTLLVDDFGFGARERAAWHFEHINESLRADSEGLSVLAGRPSSATSQHFETSSPAPTLAPASRLAFVYRSYRLCICVDVSRWLFTPLAGGAAQWRVGWELLPFKIAELLRSVVGGLGVDVDKQQPSCDAGAELETGSATDVPSVAALFRPRVFLSLLLVTRRATRRRKAQPDGPQVINYVFYLHL